MGEQGKLFVSQTGLPTFWNKQSYFFIFTELVLTAMWLLICIQNVSLFLFGQHSEITSTCITPGLLQVRRVHKLHEAQMQGFLQALLVQGFVSEGLC